MLWFTSFVTLLASLGLVLAMPGGEKHLTTSCATQSTCSAVYSTYTKEKDVPVTKVITTTVYKPETKTTTVHKPYPTTVYSRLTLSKYFVAALTCGKLLSLPRPTKSSPRQRQNMSRARPTLKSAT